MLFDKLISVLIQKINRKGAMNSIEISLTVFVSFDSVLCFDDVKCDEQLKIFEDSLRDREPWAVQSKFTQTT